jgi:spore germination protein GerM
MLLVYAIVNTVTAMDGINKAQFLVEGAQTDTLGGHLCISDPFLRNYGIIKNGS